MSCLSVARCWVRNGRKSGEASRYERRAPVMEMVASGDESNEARN